METVKVPAHVDEPPYLLLWPADEFGMVGLAFVLGFAANLPLIGIALGVGIGMVYRRFRTGRPDGYLLHLAYWVGFASLNSKACSNAFARRWLP